MKELRKEEVSLFMEYATVEKVKRVIEAIEVALSAYNFGFDECITMVQWLCSTINVDSQIPRESGDEMEDSRAQVAIDILP